MESNINLMSTSCIGQVEDIKNRQSTRILGSSSYMFFYYYQVLRSHINIVVKLRFGIILQGFH